VSSSSSRFWTGRASGASGSGGIVPSVSQGVRVLILVRIAPVAATSGWGPAAARRYQRIAGLKQRGELTTPSTRARGGAPFGQIARSQLPSSGAELLGCASAGRPRRSRRTRPPTRSLASNAGATGCAFDAPSPGISAGGSYGTAHAPRPAEAATIWGNPSLDQRLLRLDVSTDDRLVCAGRLHCRNGRRHSCARLVRRGRLAVPQGASPWPAQSDRWLTL
jgi:hypothetical protein